MARRVSGWLCVAALLLRPNLGLCAPAVLVKDIDTGGGSDLRLLTASGNFLYFVPVTPANGRELWRSDGTAAGTQMVKDIIAGAPSSTTAGST